MKFRVQLPTRATVPAGGYLLAELTSEPARPAVRVRMGLTVLLWLRGELVGPSIHSTVALPSPPPGWRWGCMAELESQATELMWGMRAVHGHL